MLPTIEPQAVAYDLQYLRELFIFTNKPLLCLLTEHHNSLVEVYKNLHIFDYGIGAFTLHKSLNALLQHLNTNQEIKLTIAQLTKFSRESQASSITCEIDQKRSNSLQFDEFIHLLILISIFRKHSTLEKDEGFSTFNLDSELD